MTDKLRTAAQMALEALERYVQEDDTCEGMEGNEPWIATKRLGEKTINILREALAEQPAPAAVAGLSDLQAQATPKQEPSYTAVKLAEMVLSDCGHSSNYTPLLDRVAERIDAHVQRHLDELRCCLESKPMPKPSMSHVDALDTARSLFDAGWKACAKFCDRDDAIYDGIVGNFGCPEFEAAFEAAIAAYKEDKS